MTNAAVKAAYMELLRPELLLGLNREAKSDPKDCSSNSVSKSHRQSSAGRRCPACRPRSLCNAYMRFCHNVSYVHNV